jgi:hypothetical protein
MVKRKTKKRGKGDRMPGPIMHLYIADKVYERIADLSPLDGDFMLAGSFAPDAVHAKPNYERSMKKKSHLREGISDKAFGLKENLDLFEERVSGFIGAFRAQSGPRRSYYAGYLSHLLADAEFALSLYGLIVGRAGKAGNKPETEVVPGEILRDKDGMDLIASRGFVGLPAILESLESLVSCSVEDFITEEDAMISKGWVIRRIREGDYGKGLSYLDEADIAKYSERTVDGIAKKFRAILG